MGGRGSGIAGVGFPRGVLVTGGLVVENRSNRRGRNGVE